MLTALGAIQSIIIALATCVYVYYTIKLLRVTQESIEEQNRPYIVVSLPTRNRKLDLCIENLGNRPAHNVKIECNPSLDSLAVCDVGNKMFYRLFNQASLAPSQRVLGLVALTPEIIRSNVPKRFEFKVWYYDSIGKSYFDQIVIDVSDYLWETSLVRANSEDYLGRMSVSLGAIQSSLQSIESEIASSRQVLDDNFPLSDDQE